MLPPLVSDVVINLTSDWHSYSYKIIFNAYTMSSSVLLVMATAAAIVALMLMRVSVNIHTFSNRNTTRVCLNLVCLSMLKILHSSNVHCNEVVARPHHHLRESYDLPILCECIRYYKMLSKIMARQLSSRRSLNFI